MEEKDGDDTDKIVLDVEKKVSATVSVGDIDRSHRVGVKRSDRPRAIIVICISYRKRNEVFKTKGN